MSNASDTNEEKDLTIRAATDADRDSLERLAQLDSARLPCQPLLVAEVDGQLRAAYSLRDGRAIANPFTSTLELVEMLKLRAGQLGRGRGNLSHGGRPSSAPQPSGLGAGLMPRHLQRRGA